MNAYFTHYTFTHAGKTYSGNYSFSAQALTYEAIEWAMKDCLFWADAPPDQGIVVLFTFITKLDNAE